MSALKQWYCKKCDFKLRAMGEEAYHKCPKSRGKVTVRLYEVKKPKV